LKSAASFLWNVFDRFPDVVLLENAVSSRDDVTSRKSAGKYKQIGNAQGMSVICGGKEYLPKGPPGKLMP